MVTPMQTLQADCAIVGSGPGGATVAREVSRKGKKVIICEESGYHSRFGYTPFLLNMMANSGLTFSKEGTWVIRPKTVGGASVLFCETAFWPPTWLREKYHIDLQEEVDELFKEIPIGPMPASLIGPAARSIMRSAQDMGLDWKPLDKWIRPDKCKPNWGKCSLGCQVGAKWTAREYVEEARKNRALGFTPHCHRGGHGKAAGQAPDLHKRRIVTINRFENMFDRVWARGSLGGGELGSESLHSHTNIAWWAAHYYHGTLEGDIRITQKHSPARLSSDYI